MRPRCQASGTPVRFNEPPGLEESAMILTLLADAAELRTAVATEQLTWATWALVVVGALALLAAATAGYIAKRAYDLEARPSVAIEGQSGGLPEADPVEQAWLISRDRSFVPSHPGIGARAEMPLTSELFFEDPRSVPKDRVIVLRVRNLGRMPVGAARINLRARIPDIVGFSDNQIQTEDRFFEFTVGVKAIPPGESVYLPIVNDVGSLELETVHVIGFGVSKKRSAKSYVLPFISGNIFVTQPMSASRVS